ncbi:MAG: hypothetical protein VZR12_03785, partial [Candidatus Cryptobacteroides sp.]|nr:hypothetical protein [Candidatus Cryptobacteroides sp.]
HFPEDPCHLVAVHLDKRRSHLYFTHIFISIIILILSNRLVGRDYGLKAVAARGHREREGPSRQAGRDSAEGA